MNKCPACERDVPQTAGKKPRVWCSEACRRWARSNPDKKREVVRACTVCGVDISHRMLKAKVCSKRCAEVGRGTVRATPLPPRKCTVCSDEFTPRYERGIRCSDCSRKKLAGPRWPPICHDCGKPTSRRSTAAGRFCAQCASDRKRARESRKVSKRRTAQRVTDITAEFERGLRVDATDCPLCGTRLTDQPHRPHSKNLDHIVPICMGGTHTMGNVRIICRTCNLARPKDGSDVTDDQLERWARDVKRVDEIKARIRKSRDKRRASKTCRCGRPMVKQSCPECPVRLEVERRRSQLGRDAARLRAEGLKWREISQALRLSGTGTAYQLAWQYGAPEVRAQWPRDRRWITSEAA